ncbi:MAG TPA: helix-hairpin-helix domain-containing protein [Propionibacteriaceae bacterium]|nr:helix-hairpin-helix domain-containing protein [Propionibacteriaceae bacterium]
MAHRTKADVELARLISDRLALVLAGRPPRRAREPGAVPSEEPAELTWESTVGRASHDDAQNVGELLLPADAEELPKQRFSRMHVGVISMLLVLGLVSAGWLLLRARPVAVASPGGVVPGGVVTVNTPAPTSTSLTPATGKSAPKIVVHVLGAVRDPGLIKLPENSRVQDAINAAGGLTRRADPGELNLAQLLSDGQQVMIGTAGDPAGEVRDQPGSTTGGGSSATVALDLNRANQAQLEELPGVGPVTAQAILTWREQHRRFSRIEELQEVDGIGPKTYAEIAPHVRV